MKKSTGIFLRLFVVVGLLAFLVGAVIWLVKATTRNEFEYTAAGDAALQKAEQLFAEGREQDAFSELEQAKEHFKQAINVRAQHYFAHYGLGRCFMLEVEHSEGDRRKAQTALDQAESAFANTMKFCSWHMGAAIARCKIYDKYYYQPETVYKIAESALKAQEAKKQADPSYASTDAQAKKNMETEIRYYLGKGLHASAQQESARLIPGPGDTQGVQERMLSYASVAYAYWQAAKVYGELTAAPSLPEGVTQAELYVTLGKISLEMLDALWQVYQAKPVPEINFAILDPARAGKTKSTLAELGALKDAGTLEWETLANLRKNLQEKAQEYFTLARQTSGPAELEETILEIGRAGCVYGVTPDLKLALLPGEIVLKAAMEDEAVPKTEKFYTAYADMLMNLNKADDAGKVMEDGLKKLDTAVMRLEAGRHYMRIGEYEKADRQMQEALQKNQESEEIHNEMAQLYLLMAGEGRQTTAEGKQTIGEARVHLQWLLEHKPEDGDYLILKGRIEMADAKYEDAQKTFEKIYEKGVPPWRFYGAYYLSALYQRQQKPALAEEYLIKARDASFVPSADVYRRLAAIASGRGEIRKALGICQDYLTQVQNRNIPPNIEIIETMAGFQEALEDKEGADKTYEILIAKGGNRYRLLRGMMWLRGITLEEDAVRAQKSFDQAIANEADMPPWQKTMGAYYGRARCEFARARENKHAAAIRYLRNNVEPLINEIIRRANEAVGSDKSIEQIREDAKNQEKTYLLELLDYVGGQTPPDKAELSRLAGILHEKAPNDPRVFQHWLAAQTVNLSGEEAAKKQDELVRQELEQKTGEEQNMIKILYAETLMRQNQSEKAKDWYLQVEIPKDDTSSIGLRVNQQLARICISASNFDEAKQYIDILTSRYGDSRETSHIQALYRAGSEKDIDTRIAILQKEVEDHPDILDLHRSLGDAYIDSARGRKESSDIIDGYRAALREYNLVLESNRGRLDITQRLSITHTALGEALARMGQRDASAQEYARSRELLKPLLVTDKDNPIYLQLLAEAELADGKNDEAVRLLERAAETRERQQKAAEAGGEAVLLDGIKAGLNPIYRRLIGIYTDMGKNDLAARTVEKMEKLVSDNPADKLNLMVTQAILAEREKKYDEARRILEQAKETQGIADDRDLQIQLIRQMSLFFWRRKNTAATDEERNAYAEERRRVFDEGVKRYPDSTQIYIWMAEMYLSEGDSDKARELLETAIKKEDEKTEGKDEKIYFYASLQYEQQARTKADLEKAEQYLLRTIEMAPGETLYKENLFDFYMRHMGVFSDKADAYAAGLLQAEPQNAACLVFKGRLLANAGDLEGAKEEFRKATEINPSLDTAYVKWSDAIIAQSRDKTDEAVAVIESGLKQNGNSIALRDALGNLYMTRKDFAKAREQFNVVLGINSRDFAALDAVARLALEELADPAADYNTALDKAVKADDVLYRNYPNTPAAYRVRGFIELHNGEPARAVEAFKQAYALGYDPVSLEALANLHLGRQALTYDPQNLGIWIQTLPNWRTDQTLQILLGRCIIKTGREGADVLLRNAAQMSGDRSPEPYLFMDLYYLNLGRIVTGQEMFGECLRRMDKDPGTTADLARLYVEAGRPDRAVELIDRVSETADEALRPKLAAMQAYLRLFELSDDDDPERVAKAEDAARRIIESDIDPKPSPALCVLGKILADRGGADFEKGIEYLRAAVTADPRMPSYHRAAAEVFYGRFMDRGKLSDMNEALKAIENVIRLDPNYYMLAALHLWRGDMYYANKEKEKALADYRKYLELGGGERAEEIKKRLQEGQ